MGSLRETFICYSIIILYSAKFSKWSSPPSGLTADGSKLIVAPPSSFISISGSPYGENLTPEQAYHMQMQANGGFEEPQTPTQNYGQMSFEDAIDGGQAGGQHNSGSYNAGQQQRRIIREIIV